MFGVSEIRPSIKQTEYRPPHFAKSLALHAKWGLNVVGPLLQVQPQLWFLLVATDYFTKWVKTMSLSEVTGQQIVKFLWQNIVCRFRLSYTIISDNGTNFANNLL